MVDALFKLSDCQLMHGLLKDMMVSMETLRLSKDTQLEALNTAKKEALDKVITFHKALEAILRESAEYSKNEVEAAYNELKNKFLQEQRTVDNMCKNLQLTDAKLTQSEGNRAQRFVCTQIAKEKVKEADREKVKLKLTDSKCLVLTFVPNQSLLKDIKYSQGIGHMQKYGEQKEDLYRIKRSRDVSIRLSDDNKRCWSLGSCLTHDDQLLVTDRDNKKLKRIDLQQLSVVDYCTLDSVPRGVCCISKYEVTVACMNDNKIQFVSLDNKMTTTRQIKTPHKCYGIAFKDDKLYVTDDGDALYIYGMTGTLLKTITHDNARNRLFTHSGHVTFNGNGNIMFVGNWLQALLCFDGNGKYMTTIKDTDVEYVSDVCMDGRGNIFVVGCNSHNVVQFSENGNKVGVMVKRKDGLYQPRTVCFHQRLNSMFVTKQNSDTLKIFELV